MKAHLLSILLILLLLNSGFAQCPIANSCTPGAAPSSAFPFGMGVYNVIIGSGATGFANPTSGASDGYKDYSCTKQAILKENVATAISVTTNPNSDENVRAWIDLNNNGTFESTTELVFTSNNARIHTGTITIAVTATLVKNTVLRMRISSDDNGSPIPSPCSTPKFGQVEDYGITVIANTSKPAVDFSVNKPITCSPTVQFTDLTQNGATTYLWSLGDNTTSTLANPSHTYTNPGKYTIKLKACNANGCDSLTKVNYINYHTNIPVASSCSPLTNNYCCGYGITKITFHNLVNTSQDGSAGFEDFTCTKSVTVEEGQSYSLAIETKLTNNQDTWVYIDYNNNGSFQANELVFTKLNAISPSGSIIIGWGAILNTPLRMRIISDAQGGTGNPCNNLISGQAEDYTIIITPNTRKPIANFNTNFSSTCDSIFQFTDASGFKPTSFQWNFGDGSATVNTQNPSHKYSASGTYTVKLKVCNNNGCDSLIRDNYITKTKPCITYCPFISSITSTGYIENVIFSTINNTTGPEPTSYGNYTNYAATITQGNSYPLAVTARSCSGIYAYIDFNQDGDFFDYNETLSQRQSSFDQYLLNIPVPNNAKPGVTRLRIISTVSNVAPPDACGPNSATTYEAEDYSIVIQSNSLAPITYFYTPKTSSCSLIAAFADTSANSPTSWQWNFGDPNSGVNNTSTLEKPTHTFTAPGTYSISLTSCKGSNCNTQVKNNYINITNNLGPRGTLCVPKTKHRNNGDLRLESVAFNTINHIFTILPTPTGCFDLSCSMQTTLVQGVSYPISVQTSSSISSAGNLKAWIDYNDDGNFDAVNELVFASKNTNFHNGTVVPPATAVLNKPLRFRISADIKLTPEPCSHLQRGSSNDYSVIISSPNGISENQNLRNSKIYPNPNAGTFSLEMPTNSNGEFHLDMQELTGKTVAKKAIKVTDNQSQQINFNQLSKGIYLLKISNSEGSTVKKIIID